MIRPFAPGYRIPTDLLLKAYASGVFPMAESASDQEVFWVRPESRGIIPLDGFHILVASIEGISRRAIPMRVREIAQVVGIVMILSLMALAFKNDIVRVLGL